MPRYMTLPQHKITSTEFEDIQGEGLLNLKIIRPENGFPTSQLAFANKNGIFDYLTKDTPLNILCRDYNVIDWTTLFSGIIRSVEDTIGPDQKTLRCDGSGYGLAETVVGQEYGTQSINPTIDTWAEIFYDIIENWANEILGTTTPTGYGLLKSTQGTLTDSVKYLFFPFKPCSKALTDLCTLITAVRAPNAGLHWITTPGDVVNIKTIGEGSSGWTSYYGGNENESLPFIQGEDFETFQSQDLNSLANYILYYSTCRIPVNGDYWTDNVANQIWGKDTVFLVIGYVATKQVGSWSFKALGTHPDGHEGTDRGNFYYPINKNAHWRLDKLGGRFNIPTLNFWMRLASWQWNQTVIVRLHTDDANYFSLTFLGLPQNKWLKFSLPVGEYSKAGKFTYAGNTMWGLDEWEITGNPSWGDISFIEFDVQTYQATQTYVDGLYFEGWALRGAKNSTKITNDKLRLRVITDDTAKDDTLIASDDSGTIAKLAYAELLRQQTSPLIATIQTPLIKDIMPGQFIYVHARPNSQGTWLVDKTMRITQLTHIWDPQNGYHTLLNLTDDLANTVARSRINDENARLADARPEFQDRKATSIKMRDIDITQQILEKDYG